MHLGQTRAFFADKVNEGNSILRVIHYPPLVPPSMTDAEAEAALRERGGHVRAAAHEDINLITLLLGADEGGLQLLRRDGRWMEVNPPPGCVTCNIGDMLQRLTNHRLPSTTHRVVNPPASRAKIPRYSMPFFLHPNPDFVMRDPAVVRLGAVPEQVPRAHHVGRVPAAAPARDQAQVSSRGRRAGRRTRTTREDAMLYTGR